MKFVRFYTLSGQIFSRNIAARGPPRAFVKPSPASLPAVRSLYLVNNESIRLCGAVNLKKLPVRGE